MGSLPSPNQPPPQPSSRTTRITARRDPRRRIPNTSRPLLPPTPTMSATRITISTGSSARLSLTLHYLFVDKDNYRNKISQKQLEREGDDYLVGTLLHMYAQIPLQILFPLMFFSDASVIGVSAS